MLALGLMIAAVFMVAPPGTSPSNIGGFEVEGPALDYRSVVAGLGIGVLIALISQVSWTDFVRRSGSFLGSQARRLWLLAWAALFLAVLFYL